MISFAFGAMPSSGLEPIPASEPPARELVEVPWPEVAPPEIASFTASGSPPVHGSIPRNALIGMYRISFRRGGAGVGRCVDPPPAPRLAPEQAGNPREARQEARVEPGPHDADVADAEHGEDPRVRGIPADPLEAAGIPGGHGAG